jgi:hypothetical protein
MLGKGNQMVGIGCEKDSAGLLISIAQAQMQVWIYINNSFTNSQQQPHQTRGSSDQRWHSGDQSSDRKSNCVFQSSRAYC